MDKKFQQTETGKKYRTLNQSWISEYKKLTPDGKDWVKLYPKKVNEINVMKLNTSNDSNANLI